MNNKMIQKVKKTLTSLLILPFLIHPLFSEFEQKVEVNLPAYELIVINNSEKQKEEYKFKISIGRGDRENGLIELTEKKNGEIRDATPVGDGILYHKSDGFLLRYSKDYPWLNIKKEDVIKWNYTFDLKGNPFDHKINLKKMKGVNMWLTTDCGRKFRKYAIHSSLDEYTSEIPASHGCLRVNEMSKLYDLLGKGNKINIPIKIKYEIIEIKDNEIILHADIYNKKKNYVEEFSKLVEEKNIIQNFDYQKIYSLFDKTYKEFKTIQMDILKKLLREYPNNFVSDELKKKLHKKYNLEDLEMNK